MENSRLSIVKGTTGSFQIEGKIIPPDNKPKDFYWATRILIDGGKRVAFIKVCFC